MEASVPNLKMKSGRLSWLKIEQKRKREVLFSWGLKKKFEEELVPLGKKLPQADHIDMERKRKIWYSKSFFLPIKYGGLGMENFKENQMAHYSASLLKCAKEGILSPFPKLSKIFHGDLENKEESSSAMANAIRHVHGQLTRVKRVWWVRQKATGRKSTG